MAVKNDAYQKIAEMWTFPESRSFRKMLELLMTPDEAALLLQCAEPITVPALAKKAKLDETQLYDKMDNLAKRGLIYRGRTEYQFRRGVHFSFAGPPAGPQYAPPEEYAKWRQIWADENPNREVNGWMEWYKKTGNPIHRVYPARLAIKSNPKIKKDQLLWHEGMEQIFQRAEIIISGPCGCRTGGGMGKKSEGEVKNTRCDHPLWNCFQFKKDVYEFNKKRGYDMRVYTVAEALAKSDEGERAGLIHEGPGNAAVQPPIVCSCAADCCRCSFGSVEMVKVPGAKKMKAKITAADCYGCGICVVGCQQKAINFDLVRPPSHIPPAEAAPIQPPVPLK
jgi:Pyruvate/2-oxoacid:ferredoxin oxidoreductase delta subunit